MQVEMERQELEKKRTLFYVEHIGINTNDYKLLNIGQLQMIINDLHNQIEGIWIILRSKFLIISFSIILANNNDLVNLLIERDSLSMEQDSILVDIEDMTK